SGRNISSSFCIPDFVFPCPVAGGQSFFVNFATLGKSRHVACCRAMAVFSSSRAAWYFLHDQKVPKKSRPNPAKALKSGWPAKGPKLAALKQRAF
ncbi:MAG: hypothetical protein E6X17_18085, partial [Sporomusaceae bacterium]|nr:hypothetical protein [Sporomusaceae bacterium]